MAMNEKVDIEIFKRRLTVEIEGLNPMEVNALAQRVSDKMTEVAAQHKGVADSSKLAILTALYMADEATKATDGRHTDRRSVEHTVDRLIDTLRDALRLAGKSE